MTKEFFYDWLPPQEAECPQDRDIQADWLIYQVLRLSLETDKERAIMESALMYEWDMLQLSPLEIRNWIDSEVGEER